MVKYRRKVISDRVREDILRAFHHTGIRLGAEFQAADGEMDHIHLLVRYPPTLSVSRLAGALKANSARAVRERGFPEVRRALRGEHFWTAGYFAASTGGASLDVVKAYVEAQRCP
jgi:putative transposase